MSFVRQLIVCLFALICACSRLAGAADIPDPHAEDRKALLKVFSEMEAGINEQNIERLLAQMTDDAVVTWLNAEVSRGKAEIRAYYRRMVGGKDAILSKYTTKAAVSAPARFFGDIAIANGTMADEFFPLSRDVFKLDSRWSSTSAKIDGQWKVVGLHFSSNVFTNTLTAELERAIWIAGGGGLIAGLLLMFALLKLIGRQGRAATAAQN
jgi:ketosteroid isomerase-like protein